MILTLDNLPYYKDVPKDPYANLRFRRHILQGCADSKDLREEMWKACARDPLFYINTFGWTYNPKAKGRKVLPFITYPYQDVDLLETIWAVQDGHDLLKEKTRDMGATWDTIVAFEWFWHFLPMYAFLLGSRKEDLVDKTGDPDTMFAKLDFFHDRMPKWLMPEFVRTHLHKQNIENGSTIDGESTNENFARGGRRTAIALDEHAFMDNGPDIDKATRDNTDCRIFQSTPNGSNNSFYRKRCSKVRKVTLHWTSHPVKAKGLYYGNHPLTEVPNVPRSPWYDVQCERAGDPLEIATECDIDYSASEAIFFPEQLVTKAIDDCAGEPLFRGELDYLADICEPQGLIETDNGRLKLWIAPNDKGHLAPADYAMGVDIAVGLAGPMTSNSVISIGDRMTGDKIGEFVSNNMMPHELAAYAVSLAKWMNDGGGSKRPAFLIWEANGPGREFGQTLMEFGHRHFFRKRNESTVTKTKSNIPGWWSSKALKMQLLGGYRRALMRKTFLNPSLAALNECREYVYGANNDVFHRFSKNTNNPAGEGEQHGDRVIADALLCLVMYATQETPEEIKDKQKQNPHPWSLQAVKDDQDKRDKANRRDKWAIKKHRSRRFSYA